MSQLGDILDAAKAASDVGAFHVVQQMFDAHGLLHCVVCFGPLGIGAAARARTFTVLFRGHRLTICHDCVYVTGDNLLRQARVQMGGGRRPSIRDYAGNFHFDNSREEEDL
jgi:hypothetical protein